jgi:hypothetical protein
MLWETTSDKQIDRFAACKAEECEAVLVSGEVVKVCWTFCWAGEADSEELEEGVFDLGWYHRYFKPSVTRRREPNP